MIFNSLQFILIFLPITLILFYSTFFFKKNNTPAFTLLIISSFYFYGYYNKLYLPILTFSLIVNYLAGTALFRQPRKWLLAAAIFFNLTALGYFKYTHFILENLGSIIGFETPVLNIIFPLAISFFTFQQITFLVDSYRQQTEKTNFIKYCLFITFFPQMLMGPIVRYHEVADQFCKNISRFSSHNFAIGLMLFSIGLAKKVLIADQCIPWVNAAFNTPEDISFVTAWTGALAYTMQIYFDFSGYTDMALGIGKFFNIKLPINFNSPYKAVSFADFWRRWHITLSNFLRDYLYIPIGGNRGGQTRQYLNIFITMLLGGLWHGANWTFILWGAYHGFFIALSHAWARTGVTLPVLFARALTFVGILVGWVFFRAETVQHAWKILSAMFNINTFNLSELISLSQGGIASLSLLFLLIFVNCSPNSMKIASEPRLKKRYAVAFATLFFACLVSMYDGSLNTVPSEFIYFDF
jgi:alginate O-acetyltransferase complex protein AlgI